MNPATTVNAPAIVEESTKEHDLKRPLGFIPMLAWSAILLLVNLPLFWGDIRAELLFLPSAVIDGQWWRVITYPLVHLTWYHLLLDAGGFLLVLHCLEEKRRCVVALYLTGASAGSLLGALALDPSVIQQGLSGLSGVAHGLMAVTALEMLQHKNQRTWGAFSLAAVTVKSIYELWSGHVFFEFMHMGMCGHPLAASHAGGVTGGILTYGLIWAWSHRRRSPGDRDIEYSAQAPASCWQKMLHSFIRALTPMLYRVHYEGVARIPKHGPAVLVCNHVSYVDWLIIASACSRPVHFVMHASIYRKPLLRWLCRLARVIPIDSGRKSPGVLRQALGEISDVLRTGCLVCIFPEGRLTRTGRIDRFRPGIEKIIHNTPVQVIPLALRGLWGSFFSHKDGPAMRRWPRVVWPRIELRAGTRIRPHHVTAANLQRTVQGLYGDLAA